MALVPVRSKQPAAGEHFITEVDESWLSRWPEDFDRLEGEDLARYQLAKSGLNEAEIEAALPSVLELTAPAEPAETAETADSEHVDDALDTTVAAEPAAVETAVAPDATA